MKQEPRPFMHYRWWELRQYAEEHWDDPSALQLLLVELGFRTMKHASETREDVATRLEELSKESFLWPKTAAQPADGSLDEDQFWYEHGLLSFMGYKVGQNGASPDERRDVLDYILNQRLPNVNSPEYMVEWDAPQTCARLKKLAESLAAFVRNAKRRRNGDFEKAIEEWAADLEYLKKKYYDGRCDFEWPPTDSR